MHFDLIRRMAYKRGRYPGITAFLFLVISLQVSASTYAQRVSLSLKNASLKKVFAEIVMQTDVNIVYDDNILKETSPVSIEVKDITWQQALDKCLKGQPLYYVTDKNIVRI
jgi:type II secretory pathway component HofQ